MVGQTESVRHFMTDAVPRGVEVGMCGIYGHARFKRADRDPLCLIGSGEILETSEDQRMVRYDHVAFAADGFLKHFFGDIQTKHDGIDGTVAESDLKPGIIVVFLQR